MKMITKSGPFDGIASDAPVTSGVRALGFGSVRERRLASIDVPSTGGVRPQAGTSAPTGIAAHAWMPTTTADDQARTRVQTSSPPV
ncbi:MAG: hypothetical protein ACRDVN_06250 [Jiangellaceae bacterium]